MSDRDRVGISFIIVLCMLITLFFIGRADRTHIRDAQRRIATLEQRCK